MNRIGELRVAWLLSNVLLPPAIAAWLYGFYGLISDFAKRDFSWEYLIRLTIFGAAIFSAFATAEMFASASEF